MLNGTINFFAKLPNQNVLFLLFWSKFNADLNAVNISLI